MRAQAASRPMDTFACISVSYGRRLAPAGSMWAAAITSFKRRKPPPTPWAPADEASAIAAARALRARRPAHARGAHDIADERGRQTRRMSFIACAVVAMKQDSGRSLS